MCVQHCEHASNGRLGLLCFQSTLTLHHPRHHRSRNRHITHSVYEPSTSIVFIHSVTLLRLAYCAFDSSSSILFLLLAAPSLSCSAMLGDHLHASLAFHIVRSIMTSLHLLLRVSAWHSDCSWVELVHLRTRGSSQVCLHIN